MAHPLAIIEAWQREGCSAYDVVRSLVLTQGEDEHGARVDLRLNLSIGRAPSDALVVDFGRVSQLKLTQVLGVLSVSPLVFEDLSGRGWDRLDFRVRDFEDEVIDFYCETICWRLAAHAAGSA